MSAPLTIESVWLAISVDQLGDEGVCAVKLGDSWMPLMAADRERLPFIVQEAEKIAALQEKRVRIIRLTAREEVRDINPEEKR